MSDSLVILGSVELGGKNTGTGTGTENTQIEYKKQSVDNGYAAHGDSTHLAYHNIIQKGNKIGNAVLDNDGNGHMQTAAVKSPVANISLEHKIPRNFWDLLTSILILAGKCNFIFVTKRKHKKFLICQMLTKVSKCNKIRADTDPQITENTKMISIFTGLKWGL